MRRLKACVSPGRQRSREFDSADRQVFPRRPTIPQHDRVGFVSGDAQDHAAPTSPNRLAPAPLAERGCGACGKLYLVPLLDQLQSLREPQPAQARERWLCHGEGLLLRAKLLFIADIIGVRQPPSFATAVHPCGFDGQHPTVFPVQTISIAAWPLVRPPAAMSAPVMCLWSCKSVMKSAWNLLRIPLRPRAILIAGSELPVLGSLFSTPTVSLATLDVGGAALGKNRQKFRNELRHWVFPCRYAANLGKDKLSGRLRSGDGCMALVSWLVDDAIEPRDR